MFIESVTDKQFLRYPCHCVVRPAAKHVFASGMVIHTYEVEPTAPWAALTIVSEESYIVRLFLHEERFAYNINKGVWVTPNSPQQRCGWVSPLMPTYPAVRALSLYLNNTPDLYWIYQSR